MRAPWASCTTADLRPIVAGILFGLLAYKPQFGLMIPLVLAASGRWRTMASATVTIGALTLATLLVFGPEVWNAFLRSGQFTRTIVLEQALPKAFRVYFGPLQRIDVIVHFDIANPVLIHQAFDHLVEVAPDFGIAEIE